MYYTFISVHIHSVNVELVVRRLVVESLGLMIEVWSWCQVAAKSWWLRANAGGSWIAGRSNVLLWAFWTFRISWSFWHARGKTISKFVILVWIRGLRVFAGLGYPSGFGQECDPMGAQGSQRSAGRWDAITPCKYLETKRNMPGWMASTDGQIPLRQGQVSVTSMISGDEKGWVEIMMLPQIDESFCVQKRMRGNFDYAVRRWRTDGSWHLDCNVIREPNQRSKVFRVIWFVQERSGPRCSTCLGYMLTKCGNEFYMCSLLISMFVGMIFFRWPSVLHVTFTDGARTAGRGRVAGPVISISKSFSYFFT